MYQLIGRIPQGGDPMPPDKHTGLCTDVSELPKGRKMQKKSSGTAN